MALSDKRERLSSHRRVAMAVENASTCSSARNNSPYSVSNAFMFRFASIRDSWRRASDSPSLPSLNNASERIQRTEEWERASPLTASTGKASAEVLRAPSWSPVNVWIVVTPAPSWATAFRSPKFRNWATLSSRVRLRSGFQPSQESFRKLSQASALSRETRLQWLSWQIVTARSARLSASNTSL